MKILHTLLGISFLYFIQFANSQLFEYNCFTVPSTSGPFFYVDEQSPFGLVFSPPVDGKLNRISLLKTSTDLNGTAFLFEGVVIAPDIQEPLSSMEFYNTYDTDLLSVYFDSVDVSAGVNYTVFIMLTNTSFATFYQGVFSNSSGSTVYQGTVQPLAVVHEMCIRYTVAIDQSYISNGALTRNEIATIAAAIGVPLVSLLIACVGVLFRHGIASKEENDDEANRKKSSGPIGKSNKQEKTSFPKFPKTSKSERKQILRESSAPSSNQVSDSETEPKQQPEPDAESSNSE